MTYHTRNTPENFRRPPGNKNIISIRNGGFPLLREENGNSGGGTRLWFCHDGYFNLMISDCIVWSYIDFHLERGVRNLEEHLLHDFIYFDSPFKYSGPSFVFFLLRFRSISPRKTGLMYQKYSFMTAAGMSRRTRLTTWENTPTKCRLVYKRISV